MREFLYQAMDSTGRELAGSIRASTEGEATAQLRSEGLFVTNIFGPKVTPKWSGVSLAEPRAIPSGPFLAEGLPGTLDQRGFLVQGSLNLLGENGLLYLIFEGQGGLKTAAKLPLAQVSDFRKRGFFRKRLVVTANTGDEYHFRGCVAEAARLLEWGFSATRKTAGGGH